MLLFGGVPLAVEGSHCFIRSGEVCSGDVARWGPPSELEDLRLRAGDGSGVEIRLDRTLGYVVPSSLHEGQGLTSSTCDDKGSQSWEMRSWWKFICSISAVGFHHKRLVYT